MSGWGYLVLLIVFLALSLGMRFLLFRRGEGHNKNNGRKNG
jgi:hypothetical protein